MPVESERPQEPQAAHQSLIDAILQLNESVAQLTAQVADLADVIQGQGESDQEGPAHL